MSKLTLKVYVDVEGEDVSEETLRTVDIQAALLAERWEAALVSNIQEAYPQLTVNIGGVDDE